MKTKVIIVDQDTNYTSHMLQVFQTRYADKVEMRVFSDVNSFYANIREAYADLVLYSSNLQLDTAELPESVVIGCLCEQSGIEEIGGVSAICKYQKVDILYTDAWIVCRKSFGYEVKDQWQSGTCDIIYFRAGRMWYIGSSCCLCTADGKGRKEDLLSEPAEVRKQQPVFYRRGHNELF